MTKQEEALFFIEYGIKKYENHDKLTIDPNRCNTVANSYQDRCDNYKLLNRLDKLNSLQKAGCLLSAINDNKLVDNSIENAAIALTISFYMLDQALDIDKVNFLNTVMESDDKHYRDVKIILIEALSSYPLSPFSCYLNLNSIYESILEQNKKQKRHVLEIKSHK